MTVMGGTEIHKTETPQTEIRLYSARKIHMVGGWVGVWVGGFFQEIIPLRGSILQVGTRQILTLAKNPGWSPSVATIKEFVSFDSFDSLINMIWCTYILPQ